MRYWLSTYLALLALSSATSAAELTHTPLGDGIELISISGDIAEGDQHEFRKLAVQYEKAIVLLESNGGLLLPALEIGKAAHLRGFSTLVSDGAICASSCALIWAAGENRYLAPKGRVGFHASYFESRGQKMETGVGNALVGRYLTQLELPERAIIFATSAPPTSIRWLRATDQRTSGIDFQIFEVEAKPIEKETAVELPSDGGSTSFEAAGEEAYRRGYQLWIAGRYDEASRILRAMASAFPGHRRVSWAYFLVGRALLYQGQPRSAAEVLLANYRQNPAGERAPDSLYYLGQSTFKLGQPGQACKAYAELESVYRTEMREELRRLLPGARLAARCN